MNTENPIYSATWLAPLRDLVRNQMGLHVSKANWSNLHRNFLEATAANGYDDPTDYFQWLSQPDLPKEELYKLARFLTIGETYFFREKNHFEPMARHILGDLIQTKRQKKEKQLRIWSAACSSGEEPYSLAILLDAMLPDIHTWSIQILATDINPHFLKKARTAVYRSWSFRGTPEWVKQRYFSIQNNTHILHSEIRNRVTFDFLNLADDIYPSLRTQTQAMDLVFCRNVLIYFDADQARKVIHRLQRSLADGGWLVLSPTETIYADDPNLQREYVAESILYRKTQSPAPKRLRPTPPPRMPIVHRTPKPTPLKQAPNIGCPAPPPKKKPLTHAAIVKKAEALYAQGMHREILELIHEKLDGQPARGCEAFLLARAQANLGKLDEALLNALNAVETDKLHAENHYLLAIIQLEKNLPEEATRSLQRVIYLDDQHGMALFLLGHLACQKQKLNAAKKYFQHALQVLASLDDSVLLLNGEGITVGRLRELILTECPE